MNDSSRDRWVVFYSTGNLVEADIVSVLLHDAGIPVVQQQTGASVYGAGTTHLLVPRDMLDQAQRVVEEANKAAGPKEGDNGRYGV